MSIPKFVDKIGDKIKLRTLWFVETKFGKFFLLAVLIGPITFIPTIYTVWTAENIDSMRTLTWPLMIIVNISGWLNTIHNGDWRMKLVMFIWIFMMSAIFIATLVR